MLMEDGYKWHDFRAKVQQDMMRPTSAMSYLPKIDCIADEFVSYIRRSRQADLTNPGDFIREVYKYALESIMIVSVDAKMNSFAANPDQQAQRMIDAVIRLFSLFPKLAFEPPLWKIFPPRMIKTFRESEDLVNYVTDILTEKVEDVVTKLKAESQENAVAEGLERTVMEKLILKHGPDSPYPRIMVCMTLVFPHNE